jgi:hypothetical protein
LAETKVYSRAVNIDRVADGTIVAHGGVENDFEALFKLGYRRRTVADQQVARVVEFVGD